MASRLDIYVPNIYDLINDDYQTIKVYRSTSETVGFFETTESGTRPILDVDVTRYRYEDSTGLADHWYKYSFLTSSGTEDYLSDALRATVSGTSYTGPTYPAESNFTSAELDTIYRVRQIIGDSKEVNRDYLSPDTSYDNVSIDGYAIELGNPKGWPVTVIIDGTTLTSVGNPKVQGYQYLVFETPISTVSGVADIWYEHFRYSDREILDIYTKSDPPCGLTAAQTTIEMYELQASITLLEGELRGFMSTSGQLVDIYEEIKIDPRGGMGSRKDDLDALRQRLKCLVNSTIRDLVSNNIAMVPYRVE